MCIQLSIVAVSIICSTMGPVELFCIWPMAAPRSLSLTYDKPEVSCNSSVDMYLGILHFISSWPKLAQATEVNVFF